MEIFVGNLPFNLTKNELIELFGKFGEITNVRMMFDSQGRFRGIAYVEFADDSHAKDAISQMNGVEVMSRSMKVDYSRPIRPRFNGFGAGFKNRRRRKLPLKKSE